MVYKSVLSPDVRKYVCGGGALQTHSNIPGAQNASTANELASPGRSLLKRCSAHGFETVNSLYQPVKSV